MQALVIDDSSTMRKILTRILTDIGYDVTQAEDGAVALDTLNAAKEHPLLCLIDWNMPNLNGYEFIVSVRKNPEWKNITLMMVTTEGEPKQIMRALAAGAHEYVIKPFTSEAIVEKLALLGLPAGDAQQTQGADW